MEKGHRLLGEETGALNVRTDGRDAFANLHSSDMEIFS